MRKAKLVVRVSLKKRCMQVVLLGVCCSGEGGADLQLQPLPLYTAPSNGTCCHEGLYVCTP